MDLIIKAPVAALLFPVPCAKFWKVPVMLGRPAFITIPAVVTAGKYYSAELPNIKGTFTGASGHNEITFESGATIGTGRFRGGWWYHADFNGQAEYSLDASRCSLIYKDEATTVQPSAVSVRCYIKY